MNEISHPGFDKPEEYETFTTTNGLEEAAEKSSTQYYKDSGYSPFPNVETAAHKSGFIAGAKWTREQMMKVAVEGWYDQYPAAIYLPAPLPGMNKGDKVRIIIVKED